VVNSVGVLHEGVNNKKVEVLIKKKYVDCGNGCLTWLVVDRRDDCTARNQNIACLFVKFQDNQRILCKAEPGSKGIKWETRNTSNICVRRSNPEVVVSSGVTTLRSLMV